MRPMLVIIAMIAALVGAAIAAGLSQISARAAQSLIAEEIGAWTAGRIHLRGQPSITLRPSPGFVVNDVVVTWPERVGHGAAPQLTVKEVTASLKMLPLLVGRLEINALTLHSPHLALDDAGQGADRTLQQVFRTQGGKTGAIFLHDGTVSLGRNSEKEPAISSIQLQLMPAADTAHMTVSGQFDLQDQTVYLDGALADPAAVFTTEGSQGYLEIATAYRSQAKPRQGEEAASRTDEGESFLETTHWMAEQTGLARLLSRSIGPVRVEGTLSINDKRLELRDADFEFRNLQASGRLTLASGDDRTLAQHMMTLGPGFLAPYASFLDDAAAKEVAGRPISIGWPRDIRLIFEGRTGPYESRGIGIEGSEFSLRAEDGTIRIGAEVSGSRKGRGQASLVLRPAGEGRGVTADLAGEFANASLDAAAAAIWARRSNPLIGTEQPPSGIAGGRFELSATGQTPRALLDSLSGTVRLVVRDGSIDGADIVATLTGLWMGGKVMSEDDGAFIPIAGRTYFDKLEAQIGFGDGLARGNGIRIVGDAYDIRLSGRLKLRGGELSGGGIVSLLADEAEARRRLVDLPFGLGGVLRAPVLAPGVPTVVKQARRAATVASQPETH